MVRTKPPPDTDRTPPKPIHIPNWQLDLSRIGRIAPGTNPDKKASYLKTDLNKIAKNKERDQEDIIEEWRGENGLSPVKESIVGDRVEEGRPRGGRRSSRREHVGFSYSRMPGIPSRKKRGVDKEGALGGSALEAALGEAQPAVQPETTGEERIEVMQPDEAAKGYTNSSKPSQTTEARNEDVIQTRSRAINKRKLPPQQAISSPPRKRRAATPPQQRRKATPIKRTPRRSDASNSNSNASSGSGSSASTVKRTNTGTETHSPPQPRIKLRLKLPAPKDIAHDLSGNETPSQGTNTNNQNPRAQEEKDGEQEAAGGSEYGRSHRAAEEKDQDVELVSDEEPRQSVRRGVSGMEARRQRVMKFKAREAERNAKGKK